MLLNVGILLEGGGMLLEDACCWRGGGIFCIGPHNKYFDNLIQTS